jgi:Holliday junction resolvasome RuvABC endonuclease subunit
MIVMALDISTKIGFAVGTPAAKPAFGTYPLPKPSDPDDFGSRFAALDKWLGDQITIHRPALLAFEAPIPPRGDNMTSNWPTIRLLIGLVSVAEMGAAHAGIPCEEVAVPTWKKGFTGTGRADKADVITKCMSLGFRVATDHEADAIGILSHILHSHRQAPTWDTGQMVPGLRRAARP